MSNTPLSVPMNRERHEFQRIISRVEDISASLNRTGGRPLIEHKFINSIVKITNNNTNYDFRVSSHQQANEFSAIETKINDNDGLAVTQLALRLLRLERNPATQEIMPGSCKRFTWANPNVAAFDVNATALQAFYNGKLNIKLGTTVFTEDLLTYIFEYVPQTQTGMNGATRDKYDALKDGMFERTPQLWLVGDNTTSISLTIPNQANTVPFVNADPNIIYAVELQLHGWIIKNFADAIKAVSQKIDAYRY